LEAALRAFRERLADEPADFFARLYFAEAMRRRYPLADETLRAFERAEAVLRGSGSNVGAANDALVAHVRSQLAASTAHREQFLPLLRARSSQLKRGALSHAQLIDLLTLLPQTGPSGIDRARAILDDELARRFDVALDSFYRAEIFRGIAPREKLHDLYRSAETALCDAPEKAPLNECERARWRLEQLVPQMAQREGA